MEEGRSKHENDNICIKPDLPLDQRVHQGLLFAVKKMLVEWDYMKSHLWVDIPEGKLMIGDEVIITVVVKDFELDVKYGDGWYEHLRHEGYEKKLQDASEKLRRGKKGSGKGASKGKASN